MSRRGAMVAVVGRLAEAITSSIYMGIEYLDMRLLLTQNLKKQGKIMVEFPLKLKVYLLKYLTLSCSWEGI